MKAGVDEHDAGRRGSEPMAGIRLGVDGVAPRQHRLFIRVTAELASDAAEGTLVGRGVLDVMLGEAGVEGLAERGAELERRQRVWPPTQRMAVVIDGLDRGPFLQQRCRGRPEPGAAERGRV